MKISCIVIDDEPLAMEKMVGYIEKLPYLNLLSTFDNAIEPLDFLKTKKVDLIFLDVQMERLTGIQFLEVLSNKPNVILTTAYSEYAIKGYDLDISDYLLKPISFERFVKAVDKVYEKLQNALPQTHFKQEVMASQSSGNEGYVFVKTEFRLEKIMFSDILYIEGMGDYLRIITPTKKIMTLQNFKKMEEMLPSTNFFRVHKSYIVAVDKIENIERNRIKINDKLIPVSETYRKPFQDFLSKRSLI
ncbi:MAG: DNA-binding response regulator [Bacteroidetes bacterium RIFOXYA12_FULL_35_11]|nr:MAG: DNA-binding response regulator [Bacteroidetes bacterium GWF2_35_48]OFY74379.1 MAG: DNA-binding response regulator [Bacteroidetes bacterium RIFOXYA12_FULL_35_11]HBX53312.1 DNA-binding response regulator [Bacteroidales bacterium]